MVNQIGGAHTLAAPFLQVSPRVGRDFPGSSRLPGYLPASLGPPSTLGPKAPSPRGKEAWSRACGAVDMRQTPGTFLPPPRAFLGPGLADGGTQECSVGGGNSQPSQPPLVPLTASCCPFSRPELSVSGSGSWAPTCEGRKACGPTQTMWFGPSPALRSCSFQRSSLLPAPPSLRTQPRRNPPHRSQVRWVNFHSAC